MNHKAHQILALIPTQMQALSRNVDGEQRQEDSGVTVLVLRTDLRQALRAARCARVRQPTGAASVKPPGAPTAQGPGLPAISPGLRSAARAEGHWERGPGASGPRRPRPRAASLGAAGEQLPLAEPRRGERQRPFPAGGLRARGPAAWARRSI